MYPELYKFATPHFLRSFLPPELVVQAYGAMIMLGVVAVYLFMVPRVRQYRISKDELSNLIFITFISAFVGGKVFYYLQEPATYLAEPSRMFENLGSGFVFYGSLIFAIPTIIYTLRKKQVPIRSFLDILAFVGPIVHSFGRMGCLLAGCCYGKECSNALGITFTNTLSKSPLNIPLYPTQIFDIIVNLLILVMLFYMDKRKAFEGQLFLVYIVMYAVGRSIVELFRGDSERGFVLGFLSHSQLIAIILALMSTILWRKWSSTKIT